MQLRVRGRDGDGAAERVERLVEAAALAEHQREAAPRLRGLPEPAVSFYCCNYFAVLRENIRHHPLATWRRVYERLVVNNSCLGRDPPDLDHGTHEGGGAFEMLAALIWGGPEAAANHTGPNWQALFAPAQPLRKKRGGFTR